MKKYVPILLLAFLIQETTIGQQRLRTLGVEIGVLPTGARNAIVDVPGIRVGHATLIEGDSIRTGVTAILPHGGNIFQEKVPAAIYPGNGFGKLAGSTQVQELGNLETPVILTNTLSVPTGMDAVIGYSLSQPGNEKVMSVNAVVGETNDAFLNDIRGRHIKEKHVLSAIATASEEETREGNIGAGTGTVAFGFKGGIGTASRKLPEAMGGFTLGVLVQSNFGGVLQVAGVPVGQALGKFSFRDRLLNNADGSCMIVVATDAPLGSRNLERLAKRAFLGIAKTGGIVSNGSGDYVIAFSSAREVRVPYQVPENPQKIPRLPNDQMSPLFMAAIEATEEAILNSIFMAETITGFEGHRIEALPLERVLPLLKEHQVLKN